MPARAWKDYRGTLEERLLKRVLCDIATQCWNFTGSKTGKYGAIGVGTGKTALAHRESYKLFAGAIPDGTELHHTCANKLCCNPAHLTPVTRREHQAVSPEWSGHKTHCINGHELQGDNLVQSTLARKGVRQCRTCVSVAAKASYRANRDKKRAYAVAHRDEINAAARARYAADPRKFIEYQKEWRHNRSVE